jgi:cache 3/cache 2 fusion protein
MLQAQHRCGKIFNTVRKRIAACQSNRESKCEDERDENKPLWNPKERFVTLLPGWSVFGHHSPSEDTHSMHRTRLFFSTITLACLVILIPGFATAESDKVKSALEDFKVMMETLGAAQLQGSDLYFGSDKADHSITDAVVAKDGGAATLFAKSGENFVSVASTVRKEDGTIAVGTTLDVKSPAYPKLSAGEPYYGEATVFGKAYDAGYEPLKDASGAVIGAYFVGYPK